MVDDSGVWALCKYREDREKYNDVAGSNGGSSNGDRKGTCVLTADNDAARHSCCSVVDMYVHVSYYQSPPFFLFYTASQATGLACSVPYTLTLWREPYSLLSVLSSC
ncbi:hypothetical protein CBL_07901 [Carabus blaptoides fortunei]